MSDFINCFVYKTSSTNPSVISELRCKVDTLKQIEEIKSLPSETAKKIKRTEYGIRETDNSLFDLSVDLHRYDQCVQLS